MTGESLIGPHDSGGIVCSTSRTRVSKLTGLSFADIRARRQRSGPLSPVTNR